MGDCTCPKPIRPQRGDLPPWECLTCGGYACEYADPGKTRCDTAICDCFIAQFPESPRDLHPEAFIVGPAVSPDEVGAWSAHPDGAGPEAVES